MARVAAMAKKEGSRGIRSSFGVVMTLALFAAALIACEGVEGAVDAKTVAVRRGAGAKDEGDSRGREVRGGRRLATAMVWCAARANVSEAMLQGALDWVCGPLPAQGQVNCGPLQSGQSCFLPDSLSNHASWAFNVYFQNHNASNDACDFLGTADQVYTDPSTSTCSFLGSSKEVSGTISNGTFTPSPPGFLPISAVSRVLDPSNAVHVSAAVAMAMTPLLMRLMHLA